MKSFISEAELPCPRCGRSSQLRIGQSVDRTNLRWYESLDCGKCYLRTESDGTGFPTEEVRKHIISATGLWKVVLTDVRSMQSVVQVLRKHLNLEVAQALSDSRKGQHDGIYEGTRIEAMWLANFLKGAGEFPEILRAIK